MKVKVIKSLEEIRSLPGDVYVRWSRSTKLDTERGYSLRFGREPEAGLSACYIDKSWDDWRILRQLQEYSFLGGVCWIITGEVVGRGGDNEPLLRNIVCLGKIGQELISADYLKMWRDETIAKNERILAALTDRVGISIVSDFVRKLKTDDRKVWERIMYLGY